MDQQQREVHVYANGRGFVVVPTIVDGNGTRVEAPPVDRVLLTLGRATVVELARALRTAAQQSADLTLEATAPWDGDGERWWTHNLCFVVLQWVDDGLKYAPQVPAADGGWETGSTETLPLDTTFVDLAEKLILSLGEQLHR